MNPTNVDLRVWLAEAYQAVGRSGEARDHLQQAVSVARAGPGAFLAFGEFFTKKAEEAFMRGLADNPESRELLERIERLRANHASA
jgi:hypothetical protein